ncbi:MAG: signal peptidase I [Paludibacteraceae bacterium]|nr:signal peptidase I [Paludibacteraceae bacterium]
MKTFQDRIKDVTTKGWISCGVWCAIYIAFVVWVAWDDWASLGWLVLLPIIADMFTTKYIPWNWWKKYKPLTKEEEAAGKKNPHANTTLYTICSWIDAIVFALVAVYFINVYIFQNYQIPTSSLEKTLRVGDFLCVNKMAYGARVPNTPLSMPLVQHTFPWGGKSYIENPQWEYKRLKGWDKVEKGDIVVFNFPTGDTVCTKMPNPDIYTLRHIYGKRTVENRKDMFGEIVVRPVDRRENYVKRCVGTPGDTLQIIDNVVYLDGKAEPVHPYLQYNYLVKTDGQVLTNTYLRELGISKEDLATEQKNIIKGCYRLPLTTEMKAKLAKNPHVRSIDIEPEVLGGDVYPLGHNSWTRDNYGPIYIPAKGDTLMITEENFWVYKRIADAYEFKTMKIGEPYVFEMDYYWMMGDNRHKSADSRYWGFVPEDHIVGRPMFVWLSIEKDNPWGKGHIRWKRIGLSNFE